MGEAEDMPTIPGLTSLHVHLAGPSAAALPGDGESEPAEPAAQVHNRQASQAAVSAAGAGSPQGQRLQAERAGSGAGPSSKRARVAAEAAALEGLSDEEDDPDYDAADELLQGSPSAGDGSGSGDDDLHALQAAIAAAEGALAENDALPW